MNRKVEVGGAGGGWGCLDGSKLGGIAWGREDGEGTRGEVGFVLWTLGLPRPAGVPVVPGGTGRGTRRTVAAPGWSGHRLFGGGSRGGSRLGLVVFA